MCNESQEGNLFAIQFWTHNLANLTCLEVSRWGVTIAKFHLQTPLYQHKN